MSTLQRTEIGLSHLPKQSIPALVQVHDTVNGIGCLERELPLTPKVCTLNPGGPPQEGGEYCEREVDELELQAGTVYLHLGARRDEPPRR